MCEQAVRLCWRVRLAAPRVRRSPTGGIDLERGVCFESAARDRLKLQLAKRGNVLAPPVHGRRLDVESDRHFPMAPEMLDYGFCLHHPPIIAMPMSMSIGLSMPLCGPSLGGDNLGMPTKKLGERVEQARKELGWSQDALAKASGLSQPTISAIESGDTNPEKVRANTLARIAIAMRKDITYFTGKQESNTSVELDVSLGRAPIISWVQAGKKQAVVDAYQPGAADEWEKYTVPASKHAFALRVRGDSMTPDFPEGTVIIVDPEVQARDGDYVVVRFEESNEATFKRLVVDGPLRLLKPLNSAYPTIQVTEDARLCGVVIEANMKRKFR
jgi:SOS-response transcriptional repressor LexA